MAPTIEERLEALLANGSPESMVAVAGKFTRTRNARALLIPVADMMKALIKERDEARQLIKQRDAASSEFGKGLEPMSRKVASVDFTRELFRHSDRLVSLAPFAGRNTDSLTFTRESRRPQDPGFSNVPSSRTISTSFLYPGEAARRQDTAGTGITVPVFQSAAHESSAGGRTASLGS